MLKRGTTVDDVITPVSTVESILLIDERDNTNISYTVFARTDTQTQIDRQTGADEKYIFRQHGWRADRNCRRVRIFAVNTNERTHRQRQIGRDPPKFDAKLLVEKHIL